jgi:hypothetical protein
VKNRIFAILAMVSIIIGCANQRIIYQEYKPEQKIHYSQMKNIENISDYAIYLDKGDKIPVKMTLDSELVDIADWECESHPEAKGVFQVENAGRLTGY